MYYAFVGIFVVMAAQFIIFCLYLRSKKRTYEQYHDEILKVVQANAQTLAEKAMAASISEADVPAYNKFQEGLTAKIMETIRTTKIS